MDKSWTLHWLQAAGTLAPWRARIRAEIEAAFDAVSAVTRPPRVDIVIHQIRHWPISELGFGGSAPSRTTMFLGFDTANPRMEARLAGGLRRVVAHEAHHCLRHAGPGYGVTLGEVLVSEGLADHFVQEVLGGAPDPWCMALDEMALREVAALAEPALDTPADSLHGWFSARPRMLPWAGYSLGWRITDIWLAHEPGLRPSQCVHVAADQVLRAGWPALRAPEAMAGP